MDLIDFLIFVLSAVARYSRNLLDSCGYVAGEISDIRHEPDVQRLLRPGWAAPTWIGALTLFAGCLAYTAHAGGALPALGLGALFGLGYWLFDRVPAVMPGAASPHFMRLLHRTLKDRLASDANPEAKRSRIDLVARIEARLGDKLA